MRCSSCRGELDAPVTEPRERGAAPTVWVITVENDADAVFEVHVFSSFAAAKQAAVASALSAVDEEDAVDRADVDACLEAAQAHGTVVTLHRRVVQATFESGEEGQR